MIFQLGIDEVDVQVLAIGPAGTGNNTRPLFVEAIVLPRECGDNVANPGIYMVPSESWGWWPEQLLW